MKKITKVLLVAICILTVNSFTVDAEQIIRYVKQDATGNGTSWENASGDLQAMVDEVEANADKGEVRVAAGTYYGGFLMKDGVNVYGAYSAVDNGIRDLKNNKTYLDGEKKSRVLFQNQDILFQYTTTWDGFYIQNGNDIGAGAFISYRSVLSNCVIRNNTTEGKAWQKGGGVAMKKCQAAGAPGIAGCLYNCVIINNHAGDEGGGIFIENGSVGDVINCVIANNTSDSSCGGLFLGDWNGWSCIQNNIIIGNEGGVSQLYQKQGPLLATFNNLIQEEGAEAIKGYDPTAKDDYLTNYFKDNLISANYSLDDIFVKPTSFSGVELLEGDWDEISNSDWSLKEGSVCINTGTDRNIPIRINGANPNTQSYSDVFITDICGNKRISGIAPDMGAYEYGSVLSGLKDVVTLDIQISLVNDILHLEGIQNTDKVTIVNSLGMMIYNKTNAEYNIPLLNAGLYIIKVERGNESVVCKILK